MAKMIGTFIGTSRLVLRTGLNIYPLLSGGIIPLIYLPLVE